MIVTFLFIIFVSFKIVLICFSIITLHLWSGKLFHEFAMVFFPMNFLPVFFFLLFGVFRKTAVSKGNQNDKLEMEIIIVDTIKRFRITQTLNKHTKFHWCLPKIDLLHGKKKPWFLFCVIILASMSLRQDSGTCCLASLTGELQLL